MARKPFDLEKVRAAVYNYSNAEYGSPLRQNPPPDWYFRACRATPRMIKAVRACYGDTQALFAVRLRVSVKTVSSWEAGYSVPSDRYIDALAALRDVAPKAPPTVVVDPADIRRLRLAWKQSQEVFAKFFRVSRVTVNNWETGKYHPSADQADFLSTLIAALDENDDAEK